MEKIGVVYNIKLRQYIRDMKKAFLNEELEMPTLVISIVGVDGEVIQVVSNNVFYGTYSLGSIIKYDTNLKSISLLDRSLTAEELRDVNLIVGYYERMKKGSSKNKLNFVKNIGASFRADCILPEIRECLVKCNGIDNGRPRRR